jgi:hypothetical protein
MHALAWAALALTAAITYAGAVQPGAPQPRPPAFQGILDEHPAIRYADQATTDPVARLAAAIAQGATALTYEERGWYLGALLRALDISPESQLLVHSKTGLQRAHTSPTNPRALYFNDSVVVGFIPGARHLEIVAHDREQGVVFYTIDQMVTTTPAITRRTNCLTCHVSGSTLDVPGVITRSNFTNANGELIPQLGFHIVDHRTPLPQRWGGWFVTGRYDLAPYGGVTHLGNVSTAMHPVNDAVAGTSNEILHRWMEIDATALGYASHESDIAALMVFDHQMRAFNLLTRIGWEARVAAHDGMTDASRAEIAKLSNELASYLLFVDEVPPPARLTPRAGFAAQFTAKGPKDSRGRSLRELELNTRLLQYGCSYMIYSPAFDALPAAIRQAVYRRMIELLNVPGRAMAREVIEILQETKADWPSSR